MIGCELVYHGLCGRENAKLSVSHGNQSALAPPRISKLMALAIKIQGMADRGEVKDNAELARFKYVAQTRYPKPPG